MQWKVVDKVYVNANLVMCKLYVMDHVIINHIIDNILNKKSERINKFIH